MLYFNRRWARFAQTRDQPWRYAAVQFAGGGV